jgi:hypothetical protein
MSLSALVLVPLASLAPATFRELPANMVRHLEKRGCAVPQHAGVPQPHNVIRGQFAKPGQTDWAVLCSRNGRTSILVFWNGSDQNPAEIVAAPDPAPGQQFLTQIRPVGRDFILSRYRAYGGPKPPPIDHQGIDQSIMEVASTVHYYYRGKWLQLQGSD